MEDFYKRLQLVKSLGDIQNMIQDISDGDIEQWTNYWNEARKQSTPLVGLTGLQSLQFPY